MPILSVLLQLMGVVPRVLRSFGWSDVPAGHLIQLIVAQLVSRGILVVRVCHGFLLAVENELLNFSKQHSAICQ